MGPTSVHNNGSKQKGPCGSHLSCVGTKKASRPTVFSLFRWGPVPRLVQPRGASQRETNTCWWPRASSFEKGAHNSHEGMSTTRMLLCHTLSILVDVEAMTCTNHPGPSNTNIHYPQPMNHVIGCVLFKRVDLLQQKLLHS